MEFNSTHKLPIKKEVMSDNSEWTYVQNRYSKENKMTRMMRMGGLKYKGSDSYVFRDRNWLFEKFKDILPILGAVATQECSCKRGFTSASASLCPACEAQKILDEIKNEKPIS